MIELSRELAIHNELKERLKAAFALDDGDEALADTLEGESALPDAIAKVLREALAVEAQAEGMKALIADNQARKGRLEAKGERLRALALWAMGEAGLSKLTPPDMTVTAREGKPELFLDETFDWSKLPIGQRIEKYSPDRKVIRAALENGPLPYARLGNAKPILTVRKR